MTAKKQQAVNNAISQARLILELYELRREAVMREARSYIGGGQFMPRSADELFDIVRSGAREGAFVLQVYGYWDMVAAFVSNGALDERMVYDTCQEMYFQYAKIQPYLEEFRDRMNLPEFLVSIERLIEQSEAGRRRLDVMRRNISIIAETRAS